MKLTRQQLDTLILMFPEGADVVEGRRDGHVHAMGMDVSRNEDGLWRKIDGALPSINERGVLLVHEGLREGGCAALGISRDAYFDLNEGDAG